MSPCAGGIGNEALAMPTAVSPKVLQKVIAKTPYIFGCDECQRVCPHNKDIPVTPLADFRTDLLSYVDARAFKNLTNRQFKETYGKRGFSWRGKAILIRNFTYIEQENTPESKK